MSALWVGLGGSLISCPGGRQGIRLGSALYSQLQGITGNDHIVAPLNSQKTSTVKKLVVVIFFYDSFTS